MKKELPKINNVNTQELNKILREEIAALLTENNTVDSDDFTVPEGKKPYVIMVVGVNGVGKLQPLANWHINLRRRANPSIWVPLIHSVLRRRTIGYLGRKSRSACY